MTAIEYEGYLERLSMTAQLIADVPIANLLNHVTTADTLGPILEPTMWMRGGADNLREARDLLDAAAPLVAFAGRLQKKAEEVQQ